MKIIRLISVFDNNTEKLIEEISIDDIGLNHLKEIFGPSEDDQLMYNSYEIKPEHIKSINDLLENKVEFDLGTNSYYVDCFQLPPYDFSGKSSDRMTK